MLARREAGSLPVFLEICCVHGTGNNVYKGGIKIKETQRNSTQEEALLACL